MSSLKVICQAFTSATFTYVFSKWKAALFTWDQLIDTTSEEYSIHLPSNKIVWFCRMFRVIMHVYYQVLSHQFCSFWLNVSRRFLAKFNLVFLFMLLLPVVCILLVTLCTYVHEDFFRLKFFIIFPSGKDSAIFHSSLLCSSRPFMMLTSPV